MASSRAATGPGKFNRQTSGSSGEKEAGDTFSARSSGGSAASRPPRHRSNLPNGTRRPSASSLPGLPPPPDGEDEEGAFAQYDRHAAWRNVLKELQKLSAGQGRLETSIETCLQELRKDFAHDLCEELDRRQYRRKRSPSPEDSIDADRDESPSSSHCGDGGKDKRMSSHGTTGPYGSHGESSVNRTRRRSKQAPSAVARVVSFDGQKSSDKPERQGKLDACPVFVQDGPEMLDLSDDRDEWPCIVEIKGILSAAALAKSKSRHTRAVSNGRSSDDLAAVHTQAMASIDSDESNGALKGCERFVLDPASHVLWPHKLMVLLAIVHDMVVIPFMLAWDIQLNGSFLVHAQLVVSFWVWDMGLEFMTGIYRDGELVTSPRVIAKMYARGQLWLDLIPIVCDIASLIPTIRHQLGLRLVCRLPGLLRLLKLHYMFEYIMDSLYSEGTRIAARSLRLMIFFMWVNHLICCAWYSIGVNAPSDTGGRWLDSMWEEYPAGFRPYDDDRYAYATAYHWSMGQITSSGIENISPLNSIERTFSVFMSVFGVLVFSFIVSQYNATIMQINHMHRDKTEQLRYLRLFLSQHGIPHRTAVRIQKQVVERMEVKTRLTGKDVQALKHLSGSLRNELDFEMYGPYLVHHPLMRVCHCIDRGTVQSVYGECVEFRNLATADRLFEVNEIAEMAFFVVSGVLEYEIRAFSSPTAMNFTAQVADKTWLCEAAIWTDWEHVGTADVLAPSEIVEVHAHKLLEGLLKHDILNTVVREYGKQFHSRLIAAVPPAADFPTDVKVPSADYGEIVLSMNPSVQTLVSTYTLQDARARDLLETYFYEKLYAEVQAAKCAVIMNAEGDLERAVSIIVLHLTDCNFEAAAGMSNGLSDSLSGSTVRSAANHPGSRDHAHKTDPLYSSSEPSESVDLLVHLGKCDLNGNSLSPNCQLPGIKQESSEDGAAAIHRLLTRLEPLVGTTRLTHVERDVQTKDSETYGMRTKYSRSTHHAVVKKGVENPVAVPLSEYAVEYPPHRVHVLASSEGLNFYCWMQKSEFIKLNASNDKKEVVGQWLSLLDLDVAKAYIPKPTTHDDDEAPASNGSKESDAEDKAAENEDKTPPVHDHDLNSKSSSMKSSSESSKNAPKQSEAEDRRTRRGPRNNEAAELRGAKHAELRASFRGNRNSEVEERGARGPTMAGRDQGARSGEEKVQGKAAREDVQAFRGSEWDVEMPVPTPPVKLLPHGQLASATGGPPPQAEASLSRPKMPSPGPREPPDAVVVPVIPSNIKRGALSGVRASPIIEEESSSELADSALRPPRFAAGGSLYSPKSNGHSPNSAGRPTSFANLAGPRGYGSPAAIYETKGSHTSPPWRNALKSYIDTAEKGADSPMTGVSAHQHVDAARGGSYHANWHASQSAGSGHSTFSTTGSTHSPDGRV